MSPLRRWPTVSLVVVSHNEGENLRRTVRNLLAHLPSTGEIVVVDDHSSDGSASALRETKRVSVLRPKTHLGAARARNFGAQHSRGEVVVFCDAHIEVPRHWFFSIVNPLRSPNVGAVGPTLVDLVHRESKGYGLRFVSAMTDLAWLDRQGDAPCPVPLLGSFFLAMRRDVLRQTGGFDPGFIRWGLEDLELSVRLWTLGFECLLVPTVEVAHLNRGGPSAPAYHHDVEAAIHNTLRMGVVHFKGERIRRMVNHVRRYPEFPAACARLVGGDAWLRRERIHASRRRDDDWYFRRFQMQF